MSSLVNRYSYSGSDANVYAYFNASNPEYAHLESMHTISFSIYEAKGRVRSLGFKGLRGVTRSVREISGTMIMTIVEDHPLRELMQLSARYTGPYGYGGGAYGGTASSAWSVDGKDTLNPASWSSDQNAHTKYFRGSPVQLPPFNIQIRYNTETPSKTTNTVTHPTLDSGGFGGIYGGVAGGDPWSAASLEPYSEDFKGDPAAKIKLGTKKVTTYTDGVAVVELRDVEIMGQGMVTSVNDLVTEVQYQFIARDYNEFTLDRDAYIGVQTDWQGNKIYSTRSGTDNVSQGEWVTTLVNAGVPAAEATEMAKQFASGEGELVIPIGTTPVNLSAANSLAAEAYTPELNTLESRVVRRYFKSQAMQNKGGAPNPNTDPSGLSSGSSNLPESGNPIEKKAPDPGPTNWDTEWLSQKDGLAVDGSYYGSEDPSWPLYPNVTRVTSEGGYYKVTKKDGSVVSLPHSAAIVADDDGFTQIKRWMVNNGEW